MGYYFPVILHIQVQTTMTSQCDLWEPASWLLCPGKGFFMHFSTATAEPGEGAFLESRWLYPKPGAQCLQFALHNTGAADDVLNIFVREYDEAVPGGKLGLFKSISGNV